MKTLRILIKTGSKQDISFFNGDIENDRDYWRIHQNTIARYFKLEEVM